MTTISAKIVADSVSNCGIRLTTLQLRYPRFIHAEFMTHRAFSRNASSSRAIPVERLIQDVLDDPAVPLFWGKNRKGMQAGEDCSEMLEVRRLVEDGEVVCWGHESLRLDRRLATSDSAWLEARDRAVDVVRAFAQAGYHKQVANRLLEPFAHINVVVTATEWENFFALRCHPAAEPHMQALARAIRDAINEAMPQELPPGFWHLPYVESGYIDGSDTAAARAIKASVARCARVSYLTHEGKAPSLDEDLALYERLMGETPPHASPAEHQAKPDSPGRDGRWLRPEQHANFKGWKQYRKLVEQGEAP